MSDSKVLGSWPLGLLREALVVLPLAGMVYLGAREEGPWLWLVQAQLWVMHSYSGSVTLVLCLLLTMTACALVHVLLFKVGWQSPPVVGRLLFLLLAAWTSLPQWLAVLGFFGALALGMGLWSWLPIQVAGPRTQVRAEDIEAGERSGSRWLAISGQALVDRGVSWGRRGSADERAVCFVSPRWKGEPVAIVLLATGSAGLPAHGGPTTVEGVSTLRGVPGLMRSSFEKQGLRIAPGAIYLEVGAAPGQMGFWGYLAVIGVGIVLFVVVVGLLWRLWQGPGSPTP